MKLWFWSVGKSHDAYVKAGIYDFTQRIQNYFKADWKLISPVKDASSLSSAALKKKEGLLILDKLQKDYYLVALEEKGQQMSSNELAGFIRNRANNGTKTLVFLIGGAYGLDEQVRARANMLWSLSELVFPHQLVRLILAEQVYRACTILRNEKYHHA